MQPGGVFGRLRSGAWFWTARCCGCLFHWKLARDRFELLRRKSGQRWHLPVEEPLVGYRLVYQTPHTCQFLCGQVRSRQDRRNHVVDLSCCRSCSGRTYDDLAVIFQTLQCVDETFQQDRIFHAIGSFEITRKARFQIEASLRRPFRSTKAASSKPSATAWRR